MVLLGNKCDLAHMRKVTQEEGKSQFDLWRFGLYIVILQKAGADPGIQLN